MQEENIRTPNEVRSSQMKEKLISTARELFAKNGFAATSTPEIVKLAGVTRGALYHHFNDKKALFKAVVTNEAECVALEIKRTVQSDSGAKQALIDGALAYFEAISVEGRAKLLLIEGPSVLGHDEIAKIDIITGGNELKQGLEYAVSQGDLRLSLIHI